MKKTYDVYLGVFKAGDDLNSCMGKDISHDEAFSELSAIYRNASDICDKLSTLAETKDVEILFADTHMIEIEAEEDKVKDLVADGILDEVPEMEDEFDDEDNGSGEEVN